MQSGIHCAKDGRAPGKRAVKETAIEVKNRRRRACGAHWRLPPGEASIQHLLSTPAVMPRSTLTWHGPWCRGHAGKKHTTRALSRERKQFKDKCSAGQLLNFRPPPGSSAVREPGPCGTGQAGGETDGITSPTVAFALHV